MHKFLFVLMLGLGTLAPLSSFSQNPFEKNRPIVRSPKDVEAAKKEYDEAKAARATAKTRGESSGSIKTEAESTDGGGVTIRRVVGAGVAIPGNNRYSYTYKQKEPVQTEEKKKK